MCFGCYWTPKVSCIDWVISNAKHKQQHDHYRHRHHHHHYYQDTIFNIQNKTKINAVKMMIQNHK